MAYNTNARYYRNKLDDKTHLSQETIKRDISATLKPYSSSTHSRVKLCRSCYLSHLPCRLYLIGYLSKVALHLNIDCCSIFSSGCLLVHTSFNSQLRGSKQRHLPKSHKQRALAAISVAAKIRSSDIIGDNRPVSGVNRRTQVTTSSTLITRLLHPFNSAPE